MAWTEHDMLSWACEPHHGVHQCFVSSLLCSLVMVGDWGTFFPPEFCWLINWGTPAFYLFLLCSVSSRDLSCAATLFIYCQSISSSSAPTGPESGLLTNMERCWAGKEGNCPPCRGCYCPCPRSTAPHGSLLPTLSARPLPLWCLCLDITHQLSLPRPLALLPVYCSGSQCSSSSSAQHPGSWAAGSVDAPLRPHPGLRLQPHQKPYFGGCPSLQHTHHRWESALGPSILLQVPLSTSSSEKACPPCASSSCETPGQAWSKKLHDVADS